MSERIAKIREQHGVTVDAVRQQRVLESESVLFDAQKMEALHRWASTVAASGMWGYKSPEEALVAVLFGLQLGMGAVEALSKIKVLHGTPTLRGPAAVAHIRSLGGKIDCITGSISKLAEERSTSLDDLLVYPGLIKTLEQHGEDPEKVAVWRTERDGLERFFWYSLGQAEAAGLTQRNAVWRLFPARMVKWQAASEAAQEVFGDWLMGAYFTEEMEGAAVVEHNAEPSGHRPVAARFRLPSRPQRKPENVAPSVEPAVMEALAEKEESGWSGERPPADAKGERYTEPVKLDEPALDGPGADDLKRRIKAGHFKTGIGYATVCRAVGVDPKRSDLDRNSLMNVANMYQFVMVEMNEILQGRTFTKGETVYGARTDEDGNEEAFFEDDSTGPEGERIALVETLPQAARMCALHAHGWEEVGA